MSAPRRWAALAVLVLPVLLIAIDMSVLGIAVPSLSGDLQPTSNQLLWIIDLYSFILAGLLILMGSLGDRIGRRRLLLIGAPLFGAASLLAAFSPNAETLIVARALLGIGGATLMPSTLGLIRTVFPDRRERTLAIAVWAAAFSGGAALGPVVGGILLEHFWWGSVFLLNVPVMLAFLPAAMLLLPESKDPNPGPFDVPSAVLSIAGILPVVYAFKTGVKDFGWETIAAFLIGAIILTVFIRRQRALAHPMIDMSLFARPGFAAALLVNIITVFAMLGVMFFFPQFLILVRGLSAAEAGLWMLPFAAAAVVGSMGSAVVARWMSVRSVILGGLIMSISGLVVTSQIHGEYGLALFVVASVLIGAGVGFAETLTNDVILATAPPERASAASAISETGYEFGGGMGTAVLGTVGMAIYARSLTPVDGMDEAQLAAAQQTLAGAYSVADSLPAAVEEQLRAAAADAFVTGLDTVAAVCAVVMLATVVIAFRGFRGVEAAEAVAPAAAASGAEHSGAGHGHSGADDRRLSDDEAMGARRGETASAADADDEVRA